MKCAPGGAKTNSASGGMQKQIISDYLYNTILVYVERIYYSESRGAGKNTHTIIIKRLHLHNTILMYVEHIYYSESRGAEKNNHMIIKKRLRITTWQRILARPRPPCRSGGCSTRGARQDLRCRARPRPVCFEFCPAHYR